MKYIDADKLIAEIEKRISILDLDTLRGQGGCVELHLVLNTITSLQQEQPEVDLEKEIKRFLSNATKMNKGEWRGKYPISDIGFRAVARHFWNKGYNARKEE